MGSVVAGGWWFGVLGPLEASCGGAPVRLGGERQRVLLALLLSRANELVTVEQLAEQLFGERRRDGAVNAVQVAVSRLRHVLKGGEEAVLQSRPGGYVLRVGPGQLDAAVFERLLGEGRGLLAAGQAAGGAGRLREALGLWRGPALADLAGVDCLQAEIRRLEELRLVAVIERVDADLALGVGGELVSELESLVDAEPLQERLRGQLMLALYRAGRQADALAVYRDLSGLLRDELGLEPSTSLQDLERSILQQDTTLEPASCTSPSPPATLPVPATAFVGRAREMVELTAMLRTGRIRLLTLTGAGGSGKTRLALRVAEMCAAGYCDGTWFVAFADITDPELIAPIISQTLEPGEEAGLAPVRRLEQWLGERQVLLVLDNLEQLADGSAVLAEVLSACPGLTLLATSREPLHLAGEQQYEVPVLEPEDAVALFESRAQAVVPGLIIHPKVADAICARLDYLPLAIELAAARTKAIGPGEILARLDTRLPLLTGGPRDAPRRQRTLKATIDWSYELLDDEQRRLFARLTIFAGGCTLAAAEAVCGAELDTLHALVDRSLLRTDGQRYWMLPILREYGLERMEQTGKAEELRRLHARWFVGLVHSEGLDARAPALGGPPSPLPLITGTNSEPFGRHFLSPGRSRSWVRLSAPDGSSEPQRHSSKTPASRGPDRTYDARKLSLMPCTGNWLRTQSIRWSSKARTSPLRKPSATRSRRCPGAEQRDSRVIMSLPPNAKVRDASSEATTAIAG